MVWYVIRSVDPMVMYPVLYLLDIMWVLWSNAMLYKIPGYWIKYSVSL